MSQLPGHPDPGRRAEPAQPFAGVDPGLIEQAMHPGHRLTARVRLTDANGKPVCARVRPPHLAWSAGLG